MPDSRHLILAVEGHLCSVDTKTGALHRITASGTVERQPAVSPEGRRIAFAAGSHDFDIVAFTFGKALPKTLLATARTEREPVWSPQQSQYAYITDASGVQEIWLRNAQEEGARPLVQPDTAFPWYQLQNVRFSPDGRRISYDIFRERHAVAISNVAGGRPVVPDEQSPDQHGLSWSPDGNWIAYRRINGAKWELVKRPLGGGEPVWLEDTAEGGGETDWSLSGEWICHRVGAALHLVSADGKRHVEVRTPGVTAFGFSRDSATLYALRRNSSRNWELAAFAVPGGQQKGSRDWTCRYRPAWQGSASIATAVGLSPPWESRASISGCWRASARPGGGSSTDRSDPAVPDGRGTGSQSIDEPGTRCQCRLRRLGRGQCKDRGQRFWEISTADVQE
jgi:hypothetical protein